LGTGGFVSSTSFGVAEPEPVQHVLRRARHRRADGHALGQAGGDGGAQRASRAAQARRFDADQGLKHLHGTIGLSSSSRSLTREGRLTMTEPARALELGPRRHFPPDGANPVHWAPADYVPRRRASRTLTPMPGVIGEKPVDAETQEGPKLAAEVSERSGPALLRDAAGRKAFSPRNVQACTNSPAACASATSVVGLPRDWSRLRRGYTDLVTRKGLAEIAGMSRSLLGPIACS